jgi:hypothetical protein
MPITNTAHLTKTKNGWELSISPTLRQADYTHLIMVADKRMAREKAKQYGAKPWNF